MVNIDMEGGSRGRDTPKGFKKYQAQNTQKRRNTRRSHKEKYLMKEGLVKY